MSRNNRRNKNRNKKQNQQPNRQTNQQFQSNQPTTQASQNQTSQANYQSTNINAPKMRLDSREFSKEAHTALVHLRDNHLSSAYHKKASGLVQGLSTYISTWGLHRMSGDMKKFLAGRGEDTTYKGEVYKQFLERLKKYSGNDFNVEDEGSLIYLDLRTYTALNRLAIQLAKEWSFWAVAVLGEAEEEGQ